MEPEDYDKQIEQIREQCRNILKDDIVLNSSESSCVKVPSRNYDFELGYKNSQGNRKTVTEAKYGSGFDEENKFYKRHYGLDSKEWKRNIWEIHPGDVSLEELADTLRPVHVLGIDETRYTTGIRGGVEGVDFNQSGGEGEEVEGRVLGEDIPENALVWVHYAMFVEGQNIPFDSSVMRKKGKPEILIASPTTLLPCLAVAIRWLRVGERGRFVLPPSVYGELGLFGTVPPNASVLLLLHVMRALDAGAIHRYDLLDDHVKKDFNKVFYYIDCCNAVAKDFFFRGKRLESIDVYKKILDMLNGCERNKTNNNMIEELFLKTYVNLALSEIKSHNCNIHRALNYLECASNYKYYDSNCKAHYLRGKCCMQLAKYDEAKTHLLKAFEMEPTNEEIGKELSELNKILSSSKRVEKNIGKKYANIENELDERDVKMRDRYICREDIGKIKESIKLLQNSHGIINMSSWCLLNEEMDLLKHLSTNNCNILLDKK